jgi:hypothetical protein
MQIHELTQPTLTEASIADRIKSAATAVKTGMQNAGDAIAANNAAQATAQQQKTQAQAAKYAQILQRQGYGTAATAPAPATPATQTPAPTVGVGGQTLDPNNPAYANLIAKAQAAQQSAATTPAQSTTPTTTAPAGPVAAPQAAQAVNTNRLQAGPVALGGAPAVMLAGDFNAALSGLKLNTNHIKELKDKIAQDASFANAFLKALGLKK